MRENETYRLELQEIREKYGNRALLTLSEAAEYLGVCDKTLKKDRSIPFVFCNRRIYVSATGLANLLSKRSRA